MPMPEVVDRDRFGTERVLPGVDPTSLTVDASAVAWSAILAGAAAAAALSLILLILGTGFGLSAVSPWTREGISATTFGVSTILWVTFTQVAAAAMGGYLAGRLRTRWLAADPDEVFFRDTAHGFLAWAVASLATAALLTSVIASIIGGGMQAGASVAGDLSTRSVMAQSDSASGPMGYFIDSLFRRDLNAATPTPVPAGGDALSASGSEQAAAEMTRILMTVMPTGTLPAGDLRYVGQVVAQRTGLTQQDAEQRVTETVTLMQARLREAETVARAAADTARKTTASTSLWLFIALLSGAFVASLAAIYGGRQRDFSPPI